MRTKISIFTPTYNRGYIIKRLFDSLQNQTYKNFEWIVVDDGSTDNTEKLIDTFNKDSFFDIIYKKQENSGKHIAINNGIKLATGELFFIVDSDDELTTNSLWIIKEKYLKIQNNDIFAGIVGAKGILKENVVHNPFNFNELLCSSLEFRYKYNIEGDMAEVFKTHILEKYFFPVFNDEKFCTESLVWNRIAKKYKMLYFNEIVYIAEYFDDGLSSQYWQNMLKSPQYSMLYYSELSKYNIPVKDKIKALRAYWGIALNTNFSSFSQKLKKVPFFLSIYVLISRKVKFIFKKKQY